MKSKYVLMLQFFILVNMHLSSIPREYQAISYDGGQRLGDRLLLYIAAKITAARNNKIFLYTPFRFSKMFKFHVYEKQYDEIEQKQLEPILYMVYPYKLQEEKKTPSCQYMTPTFGSLFDSLYAYKFENPAFFNDLKKIIQPMDPLPEFTLPKDKITVAVHVRKGGGYDPPLYSVQYYDKEHVLKRRPQQPKNVIGAYEDIKVPMRLPPEQYYVDQIKMLAKMLHNQPLFVYIFTDDANPRRIANKFNEIIQNPNITFACREQDNRHDTNVLEDFFAMTKFDCLIRPNSHFSMCAQLLGDHKIVIYPKHKKWYGNTLVINEVGIINHMKRAKQ